MTTARAIFGPRSWVRSTRRRAQGTRTSRDVFAGFAEEFDARLAALKYRARSSWRARSIAALPPAARRLAVLDAGAGTGLCGPLLKPAPSRLVGVDLSKEMLALAAKRGVYDVLDEAELTAWLATTPATFDLAVCADTLCYFRVLEDVLQGFTRVLQPGGCSRSPSRNRKKASTGPFHLQYNGRYSHTEGYVRTL